MSDFIPDDIFSDESLYTGPETFVTQKVNLEVQNLRLDKFLTKSFPNYSRNQIIRLIESGYVKNQNGKTIDAADYRIHIDDSFTITPPQTQPAEPQPEKIDLDILYEDACILVVNKPAGMVVHPGAGNTSGTLINALLYHCKESLSGIGGVLRPGIVHRIDKDTSGILVVAKNNTAHRRLSEQFAAHTIERVYQAFVWQKILTETGIVSGNIGRSSVNRQKMAVVKTNGKPAVTHYERIATYSTGPASYIRCVLETGRTHQIRVHMASINHSLIGDTVYGIIPKTAPEYLKYFPRQALHAFFLGFIHPQTGKHLSFETPLPPDMAELKSFLESAEQNKNTI